MNPRKLTAERFTTILKAIENGLTITSACKAAKVGRSTLYRELESDWDKRDALKKAEEQRDRMITDEAVAAVHSAFGEDWRAAAWWLERNHPERYSLRSDFRPKAEEKKEIHTDEDVQEMLNHSEAFRETVREMLRKAEMLANGQAA